MKIRRMHPGDPALPAVLALLRAEFAYMAGRIDPPSSLGRMSLADLERLTANGPCWCAGREPVGCLFGTLRSDRLYLGKLAVAASARGQGIARHLVETAAEEARRLGLPALELQSRIELAEVHAAFAAMGFRQSGATAHSGYHRPTSLTFTRVLSPEPESATAQGERM